MPQPTARLKSHMSNRATLDGQNRWHRRAINLKATEGAALVVPTSEGRNRCEMLFE